MKLHTGGNQLEDMVAKEFTNRTGKKVRKRNFMFSHPEYPFIIGNIDREVVGEKALLECKTCSSYVAKEWEGEEIPPSYLIQVQHYLAVTGYEKGYIAVLIGGQKFVWKEIQRDEELIQIIIEAERNFWANHIEKKVPPALDGSSAAEKFLEEKYKIAEPGLSIDLKSEYADLTDEYLSIKDKIKQLEEQAKMIENNIKNELGEAETGFTPIYQINWKTVTSNRVDSKLLKENYPDIYQKVIKESNSRRFTIKSLKEEE